MFIIVIGLNHKTASIELREKVYFAEDKLSLYLQDLLQQGLAREAVLISTCNRSELYCVANDVTPLVDWFCQQTSLPKEVILPLLYCYEDLAAIIHITEVAVGLDSMILGEPQIFGQIKSSYSESSSVGGIGPIFQQLFPRIFKTSKEIRSMTAIGACPVSVASSAIHLIKMKLDLTNAMVLLIGAGNTTQLILKYLKNYVQVPIHVINRSSEKAVLIANEHQAIPYDWMSLPLLLQKADVVFTATSSPNPIITHEMLESIIMKRDGKPLFLFDLAVPRDIEPNVQALSAVDLYCIDDLMTVISFHKQDREHAAVKAREMIKLESQLLMQELKAFEDISHTIRSYRNHIEAICQAELVKAHQALSLGTSSEEVLNMFARSFTNKLLHIPSVTLRKMGKEGRLELLDFAKQLFALAE